MATTLSYERQQWPLVRILTAPSFGGGKGPWSIQPMWSSKTAGYGFELLRFSRVCLPAIGEATFHYRYGVMNGNVVGVQEDASVARRVAGTPWDPSEDVATAPDLGGYEIRIQGAAQVAQGETPAWRTIWWGTCEYQEDQHWPGANYPAGVRTYRCLDGLARAKRWPLNRHSTYYSANWYVDVDGHPGYNVGSDGRILGNLDAVNLSDASPQPTSAALVELIDLSDTGYKFHTYQGRADAETWTVQQALEDALRKTRGFGEPVFSFDGTTGLLADTIAIPVSPDDNAWNLVARLCSRQRGRGVVFVDWADDSANPTGQLQPKLTINPQTFTDIDYTLPASSGSGTINGAGTAGTAETVDLIGDHRVVAEDFLLSGRFLHVADAVETLGEKMQTLVTMSYFDGEGSGVASIKRRWIAARATVFQGLSLAARKEEAWWPIWHLHGLPEDWGGSAKDHNGGTSYRADFYCNDDGSGSWTGTPTDLVTSPLMCRILPDLPLFEGYDYTTSTPLRKIGDQTANAFDEAAQPARRPPAVYIREASNKYVEGDNVLNGQRPLSVQVRGKDLFVACQQDRDGKRTVADITNLKSIYDLSQLGITVGIELPHRVRRKDYREGVAIPKRIVTIYLPDIHLWLAHSGAIWDLDTSGGFAANYAAKRAAGGGSGATPGILRDDRDALSRLHALACAWYLNPRQTARWTLRAAGWLPSFTTADDTVVNYPRLGQLITTLTAGGQEHTIHTPVTSVTYDHIEGRTTWETDWQDLDFT